MDALAIRGEEGRANLRKDVYKRQAVPRANGYQALQTSMIGPHGVPVEVHQMCIRDRNSG